MFESAAFDEHDERGACFTDVAVASDLLFWWEEPGFGAGDDPFD